MPLLVGAVGLLISAVLLVRVRRRYGNVPGEGRRQASIALRHRRPSPVGEHPRVNARGGEA